jgi:hypothetical protein
MSEVGILHGWRSRVFYLTRDRRFLLRTAGTIVAAGFLIASLIVTTKSGSLPSEPPVPVAEQRIQADYSRLISTKEPDPRALAIWLRRQVMVMARKLADEEKLRMAFDAFSQNGVVDGRDWRQVIDRHAAGVTKGLVHDYIRAALIRDLPDGVKARERLEQQALKESPPMLTPSSIVISPPVTVRSPFTFWVTRTSPPKMRTSPSLWPFSLISPPASNTSCWVVPLTRIFPPALTKSPLTLALMFTSPAATYTLLGASLERVTDLPVFTSDAPAIPTLSSRKLMSKVPVFFILQKLCR